MSRSITKDTGPDVFSRQTVSSMSPHHWPRILANCWVLTLCVVRKRSTIWSVTQSRDFFAPNSTSLSVPFIYYEQLIKRGLTGIHISGCRCNQRLNAKTDGSKYLTYTGLCGELEHQMIETRLSGESFWVCDGWVCDLEAIGAPSIFSIIRSAAASARMWPTLLLSCEENTAWRSERLITLAELLKLQEIGQFPDESVKIEGAQTHHGDTQTY